jgi:hypothetical protein
MRERDKGLDLRWCGQIVNPNERHGQNVYFSTKIIGDQSHLDGFSKKRLSIPEAERDYI